MKEVGKKNDHHVPKDRLNLIYLVVLLQGIGGLIAWNVFITPKQYFVYYKLGITEASKDGIPYGTYFLNFVGFASKIPCVTFCWLNTFFPFKGKVGSRMAFSLLIQITIFVVTIILAMLDTITWTSTFFWITMLCIVVLNMASGMYQNCVFALAGTLPPRYSAAVVFGMNICGTIIAIMSLLTSLASSSIRVAAIYYFLAAVVVLFACYDTYYALPLNRFYRYYDFLANSTDKDGEVSSQYIPRLPILKQCKVQCFNAFFTYFITLALFPAVQSDIRRSDPNFFISEKYYTGIMCFLTFNATSMIGSSLFHWISWPTPKYLTPAVLLRVTFIPLFLICNYQPKFDNDTERVIPILIHNDWLFWLIAALMGLTNGHFGSISVMYCTRPVHGSTSL